MGRSLNKVVLIGRIGAEPRVATTAGGTRVASFRLATDRPGRRGAERRTDWHSVVAWDRLAGSVERFVRKGDLVFVEGRIETREEVRKRRQTRTLTEVVADEVIVLGGRSESRPPGRERRPLDRQEPSRSPGDPAGPEEELPF